MVAIAVCSDASLALFLSVFVLVMQNFGEYQFFFPLIKLSS